LPPYTFFRVITQTTEKYKCFLNLNDITNVVPISNTRVWKPIIQNNKLIGAVTHVLVNDPTMGYGIFIENMLDAAA